MTGGVACDFAARTKAVRTTIHEMAQKGIPAFVDRSGREWSPEAYVNMDIRATVKNTALRYKNAGRSLVGDGSAHDYFVHEMGHHIQWEAFDAKTNNAVGSRMSQYAGGISGYATASKSEYFAESFAAFEKGELDKLDPDFVAFLRGKTLDKSAGSGIMEREREFGVQYGALSITADKDFISSKEYANLFSNITNNRAVNDSIADLSRKAILHRNGTKYEDMYIVNANTGEVMGQRLDMQYPSGVSYNDSIKSALSRAKEANIPIIAIHNHPEGYPPSIDDFNKAYDNNYIFGIACGHNGQVYVYDKPEFRIAQSDADEIHAAMNLLLDQGADPDRIYREYYNELGLSYRIEKGGGDNGRS